MKDAIKHFSTISLIIMGSACSTQHNSPSNTAAPAPAPIVQAPAMVAPAPVVAPAPDVVTPTPPATDPSNNTAPVAPPPAAPGVNLLSVISVNGLEVDGSGFVTVNPGESVSLVADVLTEADGCQAAACAERQNLGVDQFTFSADDRNSDTCVVSNAAFCGRSSNFSVSGDAMTFQTPRDMQGDITITVRQNGTALVGVIILKSAVGNGRGHDPGFGGHGGDGRRDGANDGRGGNAGQGGNVDAGQGSH